MATFAAGANQSGTRWDVVEGEPGSSPHGSSFFAVAVCANQAGLQHTTIQVVKATVAATTSEGFSVGCPAGAESTGGGSWTPLGVEMHTTAPLFGSTPAEAEPPGADGQITGWAVNITNSGSGSVPVSIGAVCLAPAAAPTPTTTTATTNPPGKPVTRLSGTDRIATAVAVSRDLFPAGGSAHVVVLARADAFPDALAGAPLAVAKTGPVLLTASDGLDSRTQGEISRVLPSGGTVYVLGGIAALGPAIDSSLSSGGYAEVREAGVNRFDTAAKVADAIGSPSQIMEATGDDFPDALSAGAAAGHVGGAVLLTNGSSQAAETANWLTAHAGVTRSAIGGAAAAADPGATPIVGPDRYGTATRVASVFFSNPTLVAAALGTNFPDALAGGAHAGAKGAPLVLVLGSAPLPPTTRSYLQSVRSSVSSGFLYGGPVAVGEDVRAAISANIT